MKNSVNINGSQVLTNKQTRKILGKTAVDLSDSDIETLVYQLEILTGTVIAAYLVHKSNGLG